MLKNSFIFTNKKTYLVKNDHTIKNMINKKYLSKCKIIAIRVF